CQPFLLVPSSHRLPVGCHSLDGAGGIDHDWVILGAFHGDPACPFGETIGVGWGGAPLGAELAAQGLRVFGCGAVFGTGFAPAEPPNVGESGAGGGLTLVSGEVGCTVVLGLDSEGLGDLGAYVLGGGLGLAAHSGGLLILGAMGGVL